VRTGPADARMPPPPRGRDDGESLACPTALQ
jgi:hypothetical protein